MCRSSYKARWCVHLASSVWSDGRHLGARLAEHMWPCGSWSIACTSCHASGQRLYRAAKDRRRRLGTMAEQERSSYHRLNGKQLLHLTDGSFGCVRDTSRIWPDKFQAIKQEPGSTIEQSHILLDILDL